MISLRLVVILLIGTVAMLIPMLIQASMYKMSFWKILIIAFILTITGTVGTRILFWIENGWYGGQSFYGAVFFVPVAFIVFAKLIKIPYGQLMDICGPAECVMLVIMKTQCLKDGCCSGTQLYQNIYGNYVFFPSQLVELINALVLAVVLLLLARADKRRGTIYAWYLLLYGSTRFVLNFFRAENTPVLIGLPYGGLWSVCAIIAGCVVLFKRKKARSLTD